MVILDEGQAFSELEVNATVFDECVGILKKQLRQPEKSVNTAPVLKTLEQIKNYFVNKCTRKSQTQKAYEEATHQLDRRCNIAENDLKDFQAMYQRLQEQYGDLSNQHENLIKQHTALQTSNLTLIKQKECADGKIEIL